MDLNKKGDGYPNHEPLMEVVVQLLLTSGRTKSLRGLIDTGASDNYIHTRIQEEYNIPLDTKSKGETVSLGEEGLEAKIEGETTPVTLTSGRTLKYKSNVSVLRASRTMTA